MGLIQRILIASLFSAGIAVALSLIMPWDPRHNGQSQEGMAVFGFAEMRALSDGNIVDFFLGMALQGEIQRVDWGHQILSVDLIVPNSPRDKSEIYRDLYAISISALTRTTNVQHVMIRVLEEGQRGSGRPQMLIALNGKRNRSGKKTEAFHSVEELEQYLREHYQISYSQRWRQLFE